MDEIFVPFPIMRLLGDPTVAEWLDGVKAEARRAGLQQAHSMLNGFAAQVETSADKFAGTGKIVDADDVVRLIAETLRDAAEVLVKEPEEA